MLLMHTVYVHAYASTYVPLLYMHSTAHFCMQNYNHVQLYIDTHTEVASYVRILYAPKAEA